MENLRHSILVFCLIILLLPTAYSISFGSVKKIDETTIMKGESGQLEILVWNRENTSYPVMFNVREAPDRWVVTITRNNFELNQNPDRDFEYIYVPDVGNIKATLVKVIVKVPNSAEEGTYDISIAAEAGGDEEGISIMQGRIFNFKVHVIKKQTFFDELTSSAEELTEKYIKPITESITGFLTAVDLKGKAIPIVMALIILIGAWVYYKHE